VEASLWSRCARTLEDELSEQQFNTWVRPLQAVEGVGTLKLLAPNQHVVDWVNTHLLPRVGELLRQIVHGDAPILTVEVGSRPAPAGVGADGIASGPVGLAGGQAGSGSGSGGAPRGPGIGGRGGSGGRAEGLVIGGRLSAESTFENFVVGKSNQLAKAAAQQVGENPGKAYNPLFIYGGVGLGKTHLMHAVGHSIKARNPDARVAYIHSERFVSDMVKALQHNSMNEFKTAYRSLDALLIDDIQFFSGKNRTQEEFFYAFNALVEAHKQVIITCDTYPKEISGMENRLISRFGWGLTVAVEPPELEMRVAILLKKAEADGLVLDENVAFFIAKHIQSNIRELEGALKRVLAYSRFTGQPITVDLAREALRDVLASQNRQVSIENIQRTVADYYKIKVSEMYSKKRTRNVARPRQVAMALAKELTQMSLPDIGEAFGGRDHTTVLHACRKIAQLRSTSNEMTVDISSLLKVLRS